jgi:hypothetical protein
MTEVVLLGLLLGGLEMLLFGYAHQILPMMKLIELVDIWQESMV